MSTIDYAIDLGTTNSLIARTRGGETEVFKNPIGHKETLASCIGFRLNRTLVGDKAREYLLKDPQNVLSGFKRKMGTSESYFVPGLEAFRSPVELSSMVLNELKNFIHDEPAPASIVITIPAAFDTVQSNATKKAGQEAGFEEVVLLQEPIAACLAFANRKNDLDKSGRWLVYDLGGGTFDVAIVEIGDTELKILDHKGDNFLGGLDFDSLLVEQVLLIEIFKDPELAYLEDLYTHHDPEFDKIYQIILHKAEELKKELSHQEQADLELILENEQGELVDFYCEVSRDQFNHCIRERLMRTITLVQDLMGANELSDKDIEQVLLVGGSTFIPLVRSLLNSELNLEVNSSVEPTTAVVLGASQYAANKKVRLSQPIISPGEQTADQFQQTRAEGLKVDLSYPKSTIETEEVFMATFSGEHLEQYSYRLIRTDGGFDTGIRPVKPKVREFVALLEKSLNRFEMQVFDKNQNRLDISLENIEIYHGRYNVDGQPLPNDICLEVDDVDGKRTQLQLVFAKNNILPLQKTLYRDISKTIYKSNSDKLIVNVLEGDRYARPATNQVIGVIEISPEALETDIVKGSEIEIQLEISESRDLNIKVYLSMTGQEFSSTFSATEKHISEERLAEELEEISREVKRELRLAEKSQDFDGAANYNSLYQDLVKIRKRLDLLVASPNKDEKYHLAEYKRDIAQKFDLAQSLQKNTAVKTEYFYYKQRVANNLKRDVSLNNKFRSRFEEIVKEEPDFIQDLRVYRVQNALKQMKTLYNLVNWESDTIIIGYFHKLSDFSPAEFKDYAQVKKLIVKGEEALSRQNYTELRTIVSLINNYFKTEKRDDGFDSFRGTGIG
jgi:molecular chaperone DnaK